MADKQIGFTYIINGVDAKKLVEEYNSLDQTDKAMLMLENSSKYHDYCQALSALDRYSDDGFKWVDASDYGL